MLAAERAQADTDRKRLADSTAQVARAAAALQVAFAVLTK
jgi:hypothetical protein